MPKEGYALSTPVCLGWKLGYPQTSSVGGELVEMQKSADERGLVAELLKYAPDFFIAKLVDSFNDLMTTGDVPHEWHKTLFKMLPKNSRSKLPSDYRPIANIRLFYKLFAYMILGRIEAQLESTQPEEQHGFRSGRRVEEH